MTESGPLTEPLIEPDSYASNEEHPLPLSTLQGYAPPPEDAELSDSVEENIDQRGKSGAGGGVILGVFVVTFDPHVGNKIEYYNDVWTREGSSQSTDAISSSEGLEFKALPAGIHTMAEDCLYFCHSGLLGVACFHKLLLSSPTPTHERNARMRSVGALSPDLQSLASCLPLLRSQARHLNTAAAAAPADYASLTALLSDTCPRIPPSLSYAARMHDLPPPPPKVFAHFVNELGIDVVTLWKGVLLGYRLLILAPPPVSLACDFVLSVCALVEKAPPPAPHPSPPTPLFSLGLHDIDMLQGAYIACTTEAILKQKRNLFDVLLEAADDGRWLLHIPSPHVRNCLRVTGQDLTRFRLLNGGRPMMRAPHWLQHTCLCCGPKQRFIVSDERERAGRVRGMGEGVERAVGNAVREEGKWRVGSGIRVYEKVVGEGRAEKGEKEFIMALVKRWGREV